jgi:hypothetical protein
LCTSPFTAYANGPVPAVATCSEPSASLSQLSGEQLLQNLSQACQDVDVAQHAAQDASLSEEQLVQKLLQAFQAVDVARHDAQDASQRYEQVC